MRFFTQDWKLVLKQLNVDFLLFYLTLCHNFNSKNFSRGFMSTVPYKPKRTLSYNFSKLVPSVYFVHKFEFLKIVYMESFFLHQRVLIWLYRGLFSKIFSYIYFIWVIFFDHWSLRRNWLILWLWFSFFKRVFYLFSWWKHTSTSVRLSFKLVVNVL